MCLHMNNSKNSLQSQRLEFLIWRIGKCGALVCKRIFKRFEWRPIHAVHTIDKQFFINMRWFIKNTKTFIWFNRTYLLFNLILSNSNKMSVTIYNSDSRSLSKVFFQSMCMYCSILALFPSPAQSRFKRPSLQTKREDFFSINFATFFSCSLRNQCPMPCVCVSGNIFIQHPRITKLNGKRVSHTHA